MTDAEFNNVKSKFSKAYLYAIIAKVNFHLQETSSEFDGAGIDFMVINKSVGLGRTVASESQIINLQLKAVSTSSASMLRETQDYIEYNLTKELMPIGNFYLVIVQLLEEDLVDNWIEHTNEKLLLQKKCAYFLKVANTIGPGFVRIPKTNVLTPEILNTLFISSENKEENL